MRSFFTYCLSWLSRTSIDWRSFFFLFTQEFANRPVKDVVEIEAFPQEEFSKVALSRLMLRLYGFPDVGNLESRFGILEA